MFDFLRRSSLRGPSAAMCRALEASEFPPGTDIAALGVVETSGKYSGRPVTFFRVFDPKRAAARAVDVFTSYTYQDLNAHLDLVLRAGFIERDGTVVRFSQPPAWDAPIPSRAGADRFVFPGSHRVGAPRPSAAVP